MTRLYALLMDEDIIDEFLHATGWQGRPFLDKKTISNHGEIKRLLKGIELHGWLKSSRFSNLVLESYEKLYKEYLEFDDLREEILDEIALVKEEIAQFERNYSLDEIMSFLRNLNFEDEGAIKALGKNIDSSKMGELEQRLAFPDVSEIEKEMPQVPKLQKPEEIRDKLKELASKVYERHRDEIRQLLEEVEE